MSVERSNIEDSFLTVAEVAELLKLNQQTVRNWIDQGSLPAIRMGRRVRIKRSDFERVLEQNYSPGAAPATEPAGPSAEDFWSGTPVGLAEPEPASAQRAELAASPERAKLAISPRRPEQSAGLAELAADPAPQEPDPQ